MKNRKGFTLTELLAVIVIMTILSVGAISGYTSMTRNSKKKSYESKVSEIENAAIKYARESNLLNSTTISVNKLVVQGYLQPDESTANGLASINNPENNENMICNLVNININDDIYEAEYYKDKKDCEVAEQDLADLDIKVVARKLVNGDITEKLAITGNTTKWTKTDVVLIVSSDKYKDFVSVSYDFDGKTVTKQKNTPSSNTTYVETDYNKIAIEDVAIMFNSEVTITYNMSDGSIHSRTIIVRIDKEAPTARAVVSNDVTLGSTKKVSLFLDDANGSGVEGFRVGQTDPLPDAAPLINGDAKKGSESAGDGVFAGYNSYFYGKRGKYYVEVKDVAGNTFTTPAIDIANFETGNRGCELTVAATDGENRSYWTPDQIWFNKDITVTGTSYNAIGTMGIKYKLLQKNDPPVESDLNEFFNPENQEKNLVATKKLSTESLVKKYYLGMKGLSRNEPVTYCDREIGLDKSDPVISIACKNNDCDTYLKTHDITITLTDMWSGFSDAAKKIEIGWSTSNTTAPTEWKKITGGTISKYKVGSKEFSNGKVTFNTSLNGYSDSRKLTGIYYLWVNKDSFSDIAHNQAEKNAVSSFSIKYDNTNPSCSSSGGKTAWQKAGFSIYGDCSDSHSGCATHTKSGNTTYDANGDITKEYSSEIDSDSESPGTVYDKAGNHTDCPSTQDVHIDLHDPTCTPSGGSSSWHNTSPVVTTGTCTDTGGSGCKGNVSKTYNDNVNVTESPGTVYDNAGRSAVCSKQTVKIDKNKPTVDSVKIASQSTLYNTAKVNVTVKGTDTGGSGISKVCIQTNDDVTKCSWKNFDGDETINDVVASSSQDGSNVSFYVWSKDTAGNISDVFPPTDEVIEAIGTTPIDPIRPRPPIYPVYEECQEQKDDGSLTCSNNYGTCSDACGGFQYSTSTQKRVDKYTNGACPPIVTPNSASCSKGCGGKAAEVCDRNWSWSACSNKCGGKKHQKKNCKTMSEDGTKQCDSRVKVKDNSETNCGGTSKVCGSYGACSNGVKKRTCHDVASSDSSITCRGNYEEQETCCTESNYTSCPETYICDNSGVYLHKTSGHTEYVDGDITICTGLCTWSGAPPSYQPSLMYVLGSSGSYTHVVYPNRGTYWIHKDCHNNQGGGSCNTACDG